MAEVQGERLRAEQELVACEPSEKLTKAQIQRLVLQFKDIVAVLATADPKLKTEVYRELGVSIIYDPYKHVVSVQLSPNEWCTSR